MPIQVSHTHTLLSSKYFLYMKNISLYSRPLLQISSLGNQPIFSLMQRKFASWSCSVFLFSASIVLLMLSMHGSAFYTSPRLALIYIKSTASSRDKPSVCWMLHCISHIPESLPSDYPDLRQPASGPSYPNLASVFCTLVRDKVFISHFGLGGRVNKP